MRSILPSLVQAETNASTSSRREEGTEDIGHSLLQRRHRSCRASRGTLTTGGFKEVNFLSDCLARPHFFLLVASNMMTKFFRISWQYRNRFTGRILSIRDVLSNVIVKVNETGKRVRNLRWWSVFYNIQTRLYQEKRMVPKTQSSPRFLTHLLALTVMLESASLVAESQKERSVIVSLAIKSVPQVRLG